MGREITECGPLDELLAIGMNIERQTRLVVGLLKTVFSQLGEIRIPADRRQFFRYITGLPELRLAICTIL
jgi:hypothetical protein